MAPSLSGLEPRPNCRTRRDLEFQIITAGNSGELIYGKINADGSSGFIHNRVRNIRGSLARAEAKQLNRSFRKSMDHFESLHP